MTVATRLLVLAHQGGWDEVLLVLAPVLVIVLLLGLAKRRAEAAHAAREAGEGRDPAADPEHPS